MLPVRLLGEVARTVERIAGRTWGTAPAWIVMGLTAWLLARAAGLGGDANWDLRNYHIYNAFALLHGRAAVDLAPAQIQTFHVPTLDLPYYLLSSHIHHVWLLNIILALPHCLAVALAFLVTVRILGTRDLAGLTLALCATLIGATGAAMLPTLATSLSDAWPVSCVLAALLLLAGTKRWTARRLLLAGLLCGAAAGLKLTTAYAGVAACAAVMLTGGGTLGSRTCRGAVFAAGMTLGAGVLAGWWWWRLYATTGNPLFPYYNAIFHSALVAPKNIQDLRFFPRTRLQWFVYPFFWARYRFAGASELAVRDPRLAMAMLAMPVLAWGALRRRDRAIRMLLAFMTISYLVWLREFAVFRYASVLELLSGTMLAASLLPWIAAVRGRALAAFGLALLLGALQMVTVYPDWGHTSAEAPSVTIGPPALPQGSLVLLLDWSAMAYLAAFIDPPVRFVGANNTLVQLTRAGTLQSAVQQAIDDQRGPIWGLETPSEAPGMADATLIFYNLRRGLCTKVISNLDNNAIHLCRLTKTP